MSGLALHLRILWRRNSGLVGLYVLLAALLGVYIYLYPGLLEHRRASPASPRTGFRSPSWRSPRP